MENTKQQKKGLKLALNIAFYAVLGLVVVYSVLALFSKQEYNSTSVFGISSLSVQSGSMSGTFEEGDLIFVNTNFNVDELEVDDVITYRMQIDVDGDLITIYNSHRIVEIVTYDNGNTFWYRTQGDANALVDDDLVFENDVIGTWKGGKLSGFGSVIDGLIGFLKSPAGFFIFIVLPCFGFLVYEVIKFVRVVSDYNVQKAVGDKDQIRQEAIAAARAELEAERKAQEEANKQV
ncbi:MAG TPA: signal peptidase I [Acholeplasmatales bacterium]|nr:signal peptidase I [Acholeplasmatales bacterium]